MYTKLIENVLLNLVEAAGGKCLPIQCDLRDEEAVKTAIDKTLQKFGALDVLINNASAISLTGNNICFKTFVFTYLFTVLFTV